LGHIQFIVLYAIHNWVNMKNKSCIFKNCKTISRGTNKICSGQRFTINMVTYVWPVMGECKGIIPAVQLYHTWMKTKTLFLSVPGLKCYYHHPEIKVCDQCKTRKQTSFMRILCDFIKLKYILHVKYFIHHTSLNHGNLWRPWSIL